MKGGETVMIGGLIKDEKITAAKKVPVLGSIPLLGHAFRNTRDMKRKTEIVIFLAPRITTGDVTVRK